MRRETEGRDHLEVGESEQKSNRDLQFIWRAFFQQSQTTMSLPRVPRHFSLALSSLVWLWLSGPDGSRHSSGQHPKDITSKIQIIVQLLPVVLPKANSRGPNFCFFMVFEFLSQPRELPSLPRAEIQIFCPFCRLWP